MNEERDFAIDDLDLERTADLPVDPPEALDPAPEPAQDPAPAPRVVIEYRSRGLHSALLPPLVLVVVVLAITIPYRRQSRLRPPAPPPAAPKPAGPASGKSAHSGPGRIIFVEAEGTGAAVEPIAVRSLSVPPALPPTPPPAPAPSEEVTDAATAPNAEAAPEAVVGATASATPAATEPTPILAHAGSQANPGPFAPLSPGPAASAPPEAPVQPALEPPAPLTSAHGLPLSPDSPELAFRPAAAVLAAVAPQPQPRPAAPEQKLTKEMIEQDIAAEAQQKKAEQKNLEREVAESKLREFLDMIQQANAQRAPFHDELRQIIRELGKEAGPQIDDLCDRYGRKDVHPDVKKMVVHALNRGGTMLNRDAKIRMMRSRGLPEPVILDVLANELDKLIRGTKYGPRTLEGVRVRAAMLLLSYPPPPIPPVKPADASPQPNPTATAVRAPAAP